MGVGGVERSFRLPPPFLVSTALIITFYYINNSVGRVRPLAMCEIPKKKKICFFMYSCIYIFPPTLTLGFAIWFASSSVQFCRSAVSDSLQPHGVQHARPPCPSPTPRVYSNSCPLSWWCHLILCHPLLLLPSIFPRIRVFSNESVLHIRWPKYWSFSFSISPSNEYSGLISFRMDWLDLLAIGQ